MMQVNRNPTLADLRRFGWAMLFGFGVITAIVAWRWGPVPAVPVLAGLGLTLLFLSLAIPTAAKQVYVAWMTAAAAMGKVMLPVMLTILFFTVVPIFSLIRFSDPLRRKLLAKGTYWERHKPHEPTLERMRRPF